VFLEEPNKTTKKLKKITLSRTDMKAGNNKNYLHDRNIRTDCQARDVVGIRDTRNVLNNDEETQDKMIVWKIRRTGDQ
jgi:hypothetical protein